MTPDEESAAAAAAEAAKAAAIKRAASVAEANRILGDAGWTPGDQWDGKFVFKDTLIVGGIAPDGNGYVKNPEAVLEGHPLYGDPAYPDEPHEAAQWLVDTYGAKPKFRYRRKAAPVAIESEAGEAPRTYDEATAEYFAEYPDEADGHNNAERPAGERDGLQSGTTEPEGDLGNEGAERDGALVGGDAFTDADFEDAPDLGAELLDDEAFAHGELPAPDPLDFAPDEIEPEPEHSPGAFIFGDNLAHDRIVRIGQLSEHATELIAAAKAGYSDSEHDAVRSHVVTNLNEAGAYVGGNPKLFDRFIELETVTARIRRIEIYRDERQDFIRSADREAVAAFEPGTGWP